MAFVAIGSAGFHEAGGRSSPRLMRLRGPMLRLVAAFALHAGAVAAAISTSSTSRLLDERKAADTARVIDVVFITMPREAARPEMPVTTPVGKPVEKKVAPKPVKAAKALARSAEKIAPVAKAEPAELQPATGESPSHAASVVQASSAASADVQTANGGATTNLVITSPRFRSPPRPAAYPKRARELGQEGEALVHARLDPDGDPEEVLIWKSSGFALLDNAALAAVRRWQFEPARRNGHATVAWVEIPVRFQLN